MIKNVFILCKSICLYLCTLPFSARLLGVDKVIQYAVNEWLTDIRKNQLPGILGGVGPMHSVVQLCEYTCIELFPDRNALMEC